MTPLSPKTLCRSNTAHAFLPLLVLREFISSATARFGSPRNMGDTHTVRVFAICTLIGNKYTNMEVAAAERHYKGAGAPELNKRI